MPSEQPIAGSTAPLAPFVPSASSAPTTGAVPATGRSVTAPQPAAEPFFFGAILGLLFVFLVVFLYVFFKNRRLKRQVEEGGAAEPLRPEDKVPVAEILNWPGLGPDGGGSSGPVTPRERAALPAEPQLSPGPAPRTPRERPAPPPQPSGPRLQVASPPLPEPEPITEPPPVLEPTPEPPPAAAPSDDDDPISQMLRDLERSHPTPPPPPREEPPVEAPPPLPEPATEPEREPEPAPEPVPDLDSSPSDLLNQFMAAAGPSPTEASAAPSAEEAPPDVAGILARAAQDPAEPAEPSAPDIAGILSRAEEAPAAPRAEPLPSIPVDEPLRPEDEDLREFETLYLADSANTSLLDYLANEYLERRYLLRALWAYGAIAEADPRRADAFQGQASCLLELERRDEATVALRAIVALPEVDRDVRGWAERKLAALDGFAPVAAPPPPGLSARLAAAAPAVVDHQAKAVSDALEKREILTVYGGSSDTSLDAIKEQVDRDPSNLMLLDWYAFQLYSTNRIPESIEAYTKLVTGAKPTANALYYLGNAYLKLLKYKEARQYWEELQSQFPENPLSVKVGKKLERIHALVRKEMDKRKKLQGAAESARRGAGALGLISPKRVSKADAATSAKAPTKAGDEPLSAIGTILERHADEISSDEAQPVFTQYTMGDGSGVDEVENLLRKDPANAELLDWAAFMNYTNGTYERARELYLAELELNADNAQAYYYLGNIYAKTDRGDEALKYWNVLLERFPNDKVTAKAKPNIEKLVAKAAKGPAAPAAPKAPPRAAPAAAPPPSAPSRLDHQKLAAMSDEDREKLFTQYAQGDGSGAPEIEALLAKDPGNIQLLDWAAFMNYTAGNYVKAREHYLRLIDVDRENPQAWYYLGSICLRDEQYQEALQRWEHLVATFPEHKVAAKARPRLEKLRAAVLAAPVPAAPSAPTAPPIAGPPWLVAFVSHPIRDLDERARSSFAANAGVDLATLLQAVETALKGAPADARLLDWAAWLCYSQSHYDRALQYYLRVLKADKDVPQSYYYIGRSLIMSERYSDAAKYWGYLVAKYPAHPLAAAAKPELEKLATFVGPPPSAPASKA